MLLGEIWVPLEFLQLLKPTTCIFSKSHPPQKKTKVIPKKRRKTALFIQIVSHQKRKTVENFNSTLAPQACNWQLCLDGGTVDGWTELCKVRTVWPVSLFVASLEKTTSWQADHFSRKKRNLQIWALEGLVASVKLMAFWNVPGEFVRFPPESNT